MQNIKIQDLKIGFKVQKSIVPIVKNISFEIKQGEIIGLVGESGSGKSVTSMAIMHLLEKNALVEGSINFDGNDLLKFTEKQIQDYRGNKIGMIFQEPMSSLNPVISCGKQVAETLIRHQKLSFSIAKEKTIDLLSEVKIPEPEKAFNKYPHEMSGGQKQRVMIAMALACNPSFLIADEPTTALDVTVQKSILDLLLKLREERNMSILFISHDLGVISEIADRIIVLYKGEIVEQGLAKDIFLDAKHPYTKALLACRPSAKFVLRKLPIISDFVDFTSTSMQSSANSIDFLRQKYAISKEEIELNRKKLYQQKPLLEIQSIETSFTSTKNWWSKKTNIYKAVNNVSFEVYPGETLGLVGESGCGKTTLSRTILKLIEPRKGKIIFDGKDITHDNASQLRKIRKDIQIIFQDPYASLNPSLTVGETLIEPLKVHGIYATYKERKSFVLSIMEKVGLNENQFQRYPHEFSGGQRQRIVIARALVLQPKLIICDESVSALDVSIQAQVLNLLKDLQAQFNLTYIFISHDIAVVKHISDRMMVMHKGEIVEIGFPEEIYEKPQKAYTQQLINSVPKIKYIH